MKKNEKGIFPCPFCGRYPEVETITLHDGIKFHIEHCCHVACNTQFCNTEKEVIDDWNRRA